MWTVEQILGARNAVLVGASDGKSRPSSFNAAITRSLLRCKLDTLTLVGRTAGKIGNKRILPRLEDIETDSAQIAVIAVPRATLPTVIEQCVALRIQACVIITGGLDQNERTRLVEIASGRLRLWGPNCVGFRNSFDIFSPFASDWTPTEWTSSPKWAVLGQSGGGALSMASLVEKKGIAVAQFFTTGDELDVGTEEILQYIATESRIAGCLLFVESPRDPYRLRVALSALREAEKPAIVVKVGRTETAARVAQSHTGAMVGSWAEFSAAVTASGGVMCASYEAAVDAASVLAHAPGRRLSRSMTVVSSSGGLSALACDLIEREGLKLAVLSDEAKHNIGAAINVADADLNPFDGGAAGGIARTAKLYLSPAIRDPQVDVITFFHVGKKDAEVVGETLSESALKSDKLIAVAWPALPSAVASKLREVGIPIFADPARLYRAISAASTWYEWNQRPASPSRRALADVRGPNPRPETYLAGMDRLRYAGIPTPRSAVIASLDEIDSEWHAAGLVFPVVAKAGDARGHKSRRGEVRPWLFGEAQLHQSVRELLTKHRHVVIEEQVLGGVEILVAARWSRYGRILSLGLGGVYADVFAPGENIVLVAEPFSRRALTTTIAQSAIGRLLRASAMYNLRSSIVDVAMGLADLLLEIDLWEVEINPLILKPSGSVAVDVKMTLATKQ